MEQKHTKEPWMADYAGRISENYILALRSRAALNACAGIPTEALEAGVVAEMVEALKVIRANAILGPDVAMRGVSDAYHVPIDDITMVEAILAKLGIKE